MALNPKRGLKDLVARRNKRFIIQGGPKDPASSQSSPSLLGLHPDPNLQRKKRKEKEIEEGEIALLKGLKL